MTRTDPAARGEKGSSLLEVLIAMAILLFLMVGVLSMFSVAFLSNMGAAARTEMTYKAQQVAGAIQYLNYMQRTTPAKVPASSVTGLSFPLNLTATPAKITDLSAGALKYPYWGPPASGADDNVDVVNAANLRYDIFVSSTAPDAEGLVTVTVSVIPHTGTTAGPRYLGSAMKWKEVDYVTQLTP